MKPSCKLWKILLAAAIGVVAGVPSSLFACAACYGRSDSPLASGMNWGIFTLLGVVLTVLTCIALFFVHVVRGEKAQNENDTAPKNLPGL
jgi:heme/copper-type cytochrome/quinol oxidase subunit 2